MSLEKQLAQQVAINKVNQKIQELRALPAEAQEEYLKALILENHYLERNLEGMANLAMQAQKKARVLMAEAMGMPQELIEKHIKGGQC